MPKIGLELVVELEDGHSLGALVDVLGLLPRDAKLQKGKVKLLVEPPDSERRERVRDLLTRAQLQNREGSEG